MHIVTIDPKEDHEEYPLWFKNAGDYASELARQNHDNYWTWAWNREFDYKVKVRDSKFHIYFDTEAALTMFALKWA